MSRIIAFPELTGEQPVDLQRLLRSRSAPAGVQRRPSLIWELAAEILDSLLDFRIESKPLTYWPTN
jgi:hypothetical protein